MPQSYFQVPDIRTGYFEVLRAFRTEVPIATKAHYPDVEVSIEGDIPAEIAGVLPVFGLQGFLGKDEYALNSGGRGMLLSNGQRHIRLKGNDLTGDITKLVAASPKNHITDIKGAQIRISDMNIEISALDTGDVHHLPSYLNKPFSFFTRASVEREKHACDVFTSAFQDKGFFSPYAYIGSIFYPTIQWRGEECGSLVFELPTTESDLRFQEIDRMTFLHLKYASAEELREISEDLADFLYKITTWHGYCSAIMAENDLAPELNSHQHQNYVICHVNDREIGASRVDHTSTRVDKVAAAEYAEIMRSESPFLGGIQFSVLFAIELARQGFQINSDTHTGYFDYAYKFPGILPVGSVRGASEFFEQIQACFERGFNHDPVPIPQQELIGIVQGISDINIDEEKQRIVDEFRMLSIKAGYSLGHDHW